MNTYKIKQIVIDLLQDDEKLLYLTQFGSHLYGTQSTNSDKDYRGIFLPSRLKTLAGIKTEHKSYKTKTDSSRRNSKDDIDISLISVQKFLSLVADGDTGALDLLFSIPVESEFNLPAMTWMKTLYDNRSKLLQVKKAQSYISYCLNQAKKYGIKGSRLGKLDEIHNYVSTLDPHTKLRDHIKDIDNLYHNESYCFIKQQTDKNHNADEYLCVCGKLHQDTISISELQSRLTNHLNEYSSRTSEAYKAGCVDWKALSHAVRCILQVKELLVTGNIVFPLKQANYISDIKHGRLPFDEIMDLISDELNILTDLRKNCRLNWQHDDNFIYDYIDKIYSKL